MPTKPRKVDFRNIESDFECALLASYGFSRKFIMQQTGLTNCQIGYRLNRASIKLLDYRNGKSAAAQVVLDRTEHAIKANLKAKFKQKKFNPTR